MTHALLAPRSAVLIRFAVADCRAEIEHRDIQDTTAMRTEFLRRLDKTKGLCLALDKGATCTLRQCAFVDSTLAE